MKKKLPYILTCLICAIPYAMITADIETSSGQAIAFIAYALISLFFCCLVAAVRNV